MFTGKERRFLYRHEHKQWKKAIVFAWYRFLSCQLLATLVILMPLLPEECFGRKLQQRVRTGSGIQSEEVGPGDVVRIDTDLVAVEVTVRDASGQAVRGLRVHDFKLFADEIEQPISLFAAESASGGVQCALDLVFVLDVSGSMSRAEMELLSAAAATFKEYLAEQRARFAVMSFGMRVKILQSFTADLRKVEKAFAEVARDETGLSSHAFDAIDDAVRLFSRSGRRGSGGKIVKRVVVIISDGFPTGDKVSARTVIDRANATNVSIFSVTMPSFSFEYMAAYGKPLPTILDLSGIVEKTGGINVYATDKNYTETLNLIGEAIRSRYLLGFYPAKDKRRDGNFHKLRVEVPSGLIVNQNRAGYTGTGVK